MFTADINWVALLVATAVKFAIGGIWYAPPVFGKKWQALTNQTPEIVKERMGQAMTTDLVMSFITAVVLAHAMQATGLRGWQSGAELGCLAWLGFIAPTMRAAYAYEGRSLILYAINAGYLLVSLTVMGAIIGAW